MAWRTKSCHCLPHFHAGVELVYVEHGFFHATLDGETVRVEEGQLLISSCYRVHSYDGSPLDAILAVIPLSAVPSLRAELVSAHFGTSCVPDDAEGTYGMLMRAMVDLPGTRPVRCGLSEALLGTLIRRVGLIDRGVEDRGDVVCRTLRYLNEHYLEDLSVDRVSAHFGYSRSRFSHMFKRAVGYSLPAYLNTLRIRSAAAQLIETDQPVGTIALGSGFSSARTFYTAFREVFGVTPAEYREGRGDVPAESTGAGPAGNVLDEAARPVSDPIRRAQSLREKEAYEAWADCDPYSEEGPGDPVILTRPQPQAAAGIPKVEGPYYRRVRVRGDR